MSALPTPPAGLAQHLASLTISVEGGRYVLPVARADSTIEVIPGTFEATADHLTLRDADGVGSFDVVRDLTTRCI